MLAAAVKMSSHRAELAACCRAHTAVICRTKTDIGWWLQVYKARVRETGQAVAVKVQRPMVRESIALDIFIMRYLVGRIGILRKLNSDLPSLLDEWAGSLFRELDYRREAVNGTKFQELYSHLEVGVVPCRCSPLPTTPKASQTLHGSSLTSLEEAVRLQRRSGAN